MDILCFFSNPALPEGNELVGARRYDAVCSDSTAERTELAACLLLGNTSSEECRAFWILNNDTEPQPGALQALCNRLNDGATMVGSTLVCANDRGTVQTAAGGRFFPATGMTRFILAGRMLEDVRTAGIAGVERKLDHIDGASLLCRCKRIVQAR